MEEKIVALIESMTSVTKKKYLKWEKIALSGYYMTTIDDNVIYIGQTDDNTITYVINNEKGESVINLQVHQNELYYDGLRQLLQAVQISNNSSQEIINKLIESMKKGADTQEND